MSSAKETEKRLQLLHQITSQSSKDLNEQLDNALELTTNLLEMEVGIISLVSGEEYKVRNFYPSDSGLEKGQVFELGSTYCSITLGHEDVLAINHMKKSEYERHPCYETFSLESYIGIPIKIRGEVFGTINFSSSEPKKGGFVPSDYTLIRLLGDWVAAIINRARIVNELKEKNERLELISTNSADLICLHDLDGVYKFISPSVKKILGYDYQELLGKNHADFIPEEDLEKLRGEPYEILKNEGQITNVRYRIKNKSGDYIWFESSVKTVFDSEGKPVGMQSTSREVSERVKLEMMFQEAQRMANVGGWEFDLETYEISWTDEVYRIHDKEIGSEIDFESGLDNFPGEGKEKIQSAIERAMQTGEPYDVVVPFVSNKGVEKWVRAIGKAQEEDRKVKSLSGTFQDISQQVQYEKRIIAQNEELLNLTKTRDQLYSIIAHDLKSAFFGINGMLEIVCEELENEEYERAEILQKLQLLQNSGKNTYELLQNLLEWIRIQDGVQEVSDEKVEIKKLINDSVDVLNTSASHKNITIETDIETVYAKGDSTMLATVFRNLISNAIKYSNRDNKVVVEAEKDGSSVVIRVKDFGIGMPDSVKKKLFDKDERPQRRGTAHEKGTGLGLLLCYELVEANHGAIDVISEEGEGTEFVVTLPGFN